MFVSSPGNKNKSWPNIEILMNPLSPTTAVYTQDVLEMVPILALPKSLGTIKLASKDPKVPPKIDPNWLNDTRDMRDLVDSKYVVYDTGNIDLAAQIDPMILLVELVRLNLNQSMEYVCEINLS